MQKSGYLTPLLTPGPISFDFIEARKMKAILLICVFTLISVRGDGQYSYWFDASVSKNKHVSFLFQQEILSMLKNI